MNSDNFRISGVNSSEVEIEILDADEFENQFSLGSFIKIPFDDNGINFGVGIIDDYRIKSINNDSEESEAERVIFTIKVKLFGSLLFDESNVTFNRGINGIPLPPQTGISILSNEELSMIYKSGINVNDIFEFSTLPKNSNVPVQMNGNKFFNKHFAIVGATGSGKSHTVAKILQKAITMKNDGYEGLNNSHIVLFDIHGEYPSAFPNGNHIDISELVLPFWMLNSEELEELFIDTEANDHNQRNVFKEYVIESKKNLFTGSEEELDRIHYDSPLLFDIYAVYENIKAKNEETIQGTRGPKAGPLNGKLSNFVSRLENKLNDKRLEFILGEDTRSITFEEVIRRFVGYVTNQNSNITVFNLSGIPFEVLSISVSLISRILFEFGFYYSKVREEGSNEIPLLLVYEEAHKYVPRSNLERFRASRTSIERIAKEGRKYGVTLGIVSQRPSEISETIFSQCNNFVSMRLTNPDDQNYVKKLLPDTLGSITNLLPVLKSGEALLIGEAINLPTLVLIDRCSPQPKSNDIMFLEEWKKEWETLDFDRLLEPWKKR
ncbi:MAG: AAA-like domain protein [Candidatus Izimaplasma bacterium HR2]|nr:MAG: AAA-like domain protein [Candidatus Izimaplasma bacterium HR2]